MLNLRDILATIPVVTPRVKNVSDITINVKEGKVTLSEKFFNEADIQNNYGAIFFKGDSLYLFLHHNEQYQIDLFKGKRVAEVDAEGNPVLDAEGNKVLSNNIGKKSRAFKDKSFAREQGLTFYQMVEALFPTVTGKDSIKLKAVEMPMIEGAENSHKLYSVELETEEKEEETSLVNAEEVE